MSISFAGKEYKTSDFYEKVTGCWGAFTRTTQNVSNRVSSATSQLWNSIQYPNKILFERGEGFWSTPKKEGDKSFLGRLTEPKSQREDWYKVTPYIAEFWCAVSNIGFIYVGLQHDSPELLFAGAASIVSHSIPKQWLLTVDKVGAVVVLSKVIREYKTIANHPWLIAPVAMVGVINMSDAYLARTKGQTFPHVIWHLSAAFLSNIVLSFSE